LSYGNALIFQCKFFRRKAENRLPDPSEICALDFKGEFRRFGICTVSPTIGINWSIFDVVGCDRVVGSNRLGARFLDLPRAETRALRLLEHGARGPSRLPFWDAFRTRPVAQAIMRGVNAAVVGLLGAALYNPVWTSAVKSPGDFGIALVGFVLLTVWRTPPLVVVAVSAIGGIVLALAAP
jgi:hypothetical protein